MVPYLLPDVPPGKSPGGAPRNPPGGAPRNPGWGTSRGRSVRAGAEAEPEGYDTAEAEAGAGKL